MTTATLVAGNRTMDTESRPRRSLEDLVDQLFAAMGFKDEPETAEPSATRSIHEARRLRQAGDVDTALAVLGSVNVARATPRETRWAFSEWTGLVKRRFGGGEVMVYSQDTGRAAALVPTGDGGTLEVAAVMGMRWRPRQAGLGAQPPGAQAPGRGCVMVTANVDIAALKARHPLGDTVEAAGVRLVGRGRVRQGVCPFHDEAEGSFTVYEDSQRFWCFGCGSGGDVLDFIQRSEDLTLPDAIARLDGSPGLAPGAAPRPVRTRRPCVRRASSPGPRPADGGGALLRRNAPAFDRSAGIPGLPGRRPRRRSRPRPRLLAGRRAAAGPGVLRLLG